MFNPGKGIFRMFIHHAVPATFKKEHILSGPLT